jgi:hypothetical protein
MLSYFHDNDMVTEKFIICLVLQTFMHAYYGNGESDMCLSNGNGESDIWLSNW